MLFLAVILVFVPVAEAQDIPSFDGATVADQMYEAGVAIEALELPAAAGGSGDLTYALSPLPPGLEFDAGLRTLSGTPSEIAIFLMTYEVTDADGATATLTFNILVEEEDVAPSFDGATVADQMFSAGVAIEALELPAASSGNGDLTYALRPIPPGLEFDAGSRTLSGTPSEVAISLMTYEVTDADGDTATLTFEIKVDTMPSFDGATVADQSYRTGEDIGVLELPQASVGEYEEPPRYSLSPEVLGLTFDAASLTLSGTPTVAGTYEMTYRVEDSDTNMEESDAEELTFTVSVELTFAAVAARQTTFTAGEEIKQPWELPVGRSTDALTYSLIGELPPGLVFDAEARTLSGTPPADVLYAASYAFTYRAVDSDGDSAELTFTIVVAGMPSFGDQVVEDQLYTAGDEVSLGLPEAAGGNVALTYTLEGELPAGLVFDAEARTLSGTPPADVLYAASYAFTYRVADSDGDDAVLSFAIVVDGMPSFDGKTVDVPQEPYQTGEAMSLTLPEPTGGNVIWEYRLKGELPPGLEFDDDPAKREISGTPPADVLYAAEYELTLEVWDGDGDVAELPFAIVVDGMPSFGDDKTVDAKPSYPAGEAMSLTLPDAEGGNVELTYSLEVPRELGLVFDVATRTLSGSPSAYRLYAAEYELTLEVWDGDGDVAELPFAIVVDGMPSFVAEVDAQSYEAGDPVNLELPRALGGNVKLTYSLVGLPENRGLAFDPATRTISGTLPADSLYAAKPYTLTYRVEDDDGDAMTLNFTIAVNGRPGFVAEVDAQSYEAGDPVNLELPRALGGNVKLTYSLDEEELPPGLVFDADTRTISGTLPEYASYTVEGYALTYRVDDSDVDFDESSFTIRVDGMPRFDETVSERITFAEGQTIDPWVLPSASGGNGQLTYELVGELPEGLTYDGATRTISGALSADATYAAESEGYALTYQVADQDGDAPDALVFTIVVHGMPSFGDQVVEDQSYEAGGEETLALPEAAGGNGALTYTLDGELPAGLAFDGASRTISGTLPTDATYAESYALTYRVADVDGDAVTLRFTIAVNGVPSFVSAQDDLSYEAGAAIDPLELPEAVGGNVARTYRLDGELPPGLAFDPATRTISGELPEYASYVAEGYGLTYRVKDVDDEEPAPLVFTIRVDGMPRFDETVSERITFAEGQTIDPWVLPSASGGNGQLTYELVGELPEGLTYDGATRTISGALSADATYAAESEGYALTYQVADQDGDAPDALVFTIVVHGMPSFSAQVVEDQLYTAGDEVSLGLPEAVGGNGALTYTLEGELPPGLAFDGAARTISGTLPADYLYVAEGYALTYRVADVDGDAVTLRFTIAVNGIPSFGDQVVEDQLYTAGEAVSLELPEAVGGNVALTYFLDGELPPGLAFNPTSRTISGELSPNVSYSPEGYALTYRVADVDGEEPAPLTFTISVNGMPFFEGTITNQRIPEGEEMAPLELPAALGGNGELTYSLNEENLPPGLAFDPTSRTISGTPELHVSHPAEGYELTYKVEDEDGDLAELSFFLTVDGTPTFFDATIEDRILRQNEAMEPWELPAASGGNGELIYGLSPDVPGLSFDAASRTISGTPTDTGTYHLIYRVEDVDGDSAELRFSVTIDGAPSFNGTVANQTYIEGEAIEDLSLPKASGGNVEFGELTYSLAPDVPGLSFDAVALMLSGTPTEVGTYTLTYTAHDEDDNRDDSDAAILSFEVRVEESATDRFAELNDQILSKYALAIADGTNRAIENRLEQMDRVGDENRSFRFAAESTLHEMIQSGRIFENSPVNLSQVVDGSSFAVPFGFGRGCLVCPGSPTFWGRGDYGQMSSDDGSLDWDGNLTRAQIGLDARPGAEMLTGLALSWAQGSFDYTAPLLGEERVDGTYETRMLSLHPYVGFSPGRLGVWLTAGLGRGNLDIDDQQGTVGQQSSDTSLRTGSVGASGDLLSDGPTQLRIKAAATVAQVEVEGGEVEDGKGNRIAEQTVSANRLRLALKASHAYEAGMDGQVTPELEVALRQDGGDGLTGAGVEVGGGLRYEGGGFTLEAMARSLVSDGDDKVDYKEWGAHLLLQRSAGTGGRGLSLRVMPTYGTQANSLTLWERSVAEIADRGAVNAQGRLRAEVGYGLAAPGGRGLYTVYSGMTQAPAQMQLRLGTRFEVDSSLSVSLESTRWQRMASTAEHGLLLRGRLVF